MSETTSQHEITTPGVEDPPTDDSEPQTLTDAEIAQATVRLAGLLAVAKCRPQESRGFATNMIIAPYDNLDYRDRMWAEAIDKIVWRKIITPELIDRIGKDRAGVQMRDSHGRERPESQII